MKNTRVLVYILLIIFVAVNVYAGSCTNSDNGPTNLKDVAKYLGIAGTSSDQFGSYRDTCIFTELSDKKVNSSAWLRDFYCGNSGIVMHTDFKCSNYGFEGCVTGDQGSYCKSNQTVSTTSSQRIMTSSDTVVAPKKLADFYCGDKVMNRANAECYPPGRLCVKDKLPGQCSTDCKCVLVVLKGQANPTSNDVSASGTSDAQTIAQESNPSQQTSGQQASLEIKVPEQKGVSTKLYGAEKTQSSGESPLKQTVTLKIILGIASVVKELWVKLAGLF